MREYQTIQYGTCAVGFAALWQQFVFFFCSPVAAIFFVSELVGDRRNVYFFIFLMFFINMRPCFNLRVLFCSFVLAMGESNNLYLC